MANAQVQAQLVVVSNEEYNSETIKELSQIVGLHMTALAEALSSNPRVSGITFACQNVYPEISFYSPPPTP